MSINHLTERQKHKRKYQDQRKKGPKGIYSLKNDTIMIWLKYFRRKYYEKYYSIKRGRVEKWSKTDSRRNSKYVFNDYVKEMKSVPLHK